MTDERPGYISNVLLNQAPRTDVQAAEIKISETVRTLYGLTVDNAIVDKALQNIKSIQKDLATFVTSGTYTVPAGVSLIDVFLCGGGGGGAGGTFGYGGGGGITNYVSNALGGAGGAGGNGIVIINPTRRYL